MNRILRLDTTDGNGIDNEQINEISPFEKAQFRDLVKYRNVVVRSQPDPIYNCHGMTFASRRTSVSGETTFSQILADDSYRQVSTAEALPGDVIIYYDEDGAIEHTGVVLTAPEREPLKVPWIMSKWGKWSELIHLANNCPYSFADARYYRIAR